MKITESQIQHFHRQGFFLIPNPLGDEGLRAVDRIQQDNEPEWENTDWPKGFNIGACQFLMVGETLLQMVEQPHLLEIAKQILNCNLVHIGACGLGDASKTISADGRPRRQVHWHADGNLDVHQVSFRTALDKHDPTNAPLRVLPGSHKRQREEVVEELSQIELATGQHDSTPDLLFARHPHEIEVLLDPRWTLVWTPSCWHATGIKTAAGPRRALAFNYYPPGGRKRDLEALKHIYKGKWESWTEERKRLWGLCD